MKGDRVGIGILVVDLINDFVTGKLGNPRAQAIIPNVSRLVNAARIKNIAIIYITDAHLHGIDLEFEVWGSHAEAGTLGAEIVPELEPLKGDFHLYKRRYSAFYATGLDALLRELEIDTIVLTGVLTNICIQHTAADAFFRGYNIIVPFDCVEALNDDEQKTSMEFMKRMYNIEVTDSEKIIKRF
jgi:nicotinamidase-related amidase